MKILIWLLIIYTVSAAFAWGNPIRECDATRAIVGEAANQGERGMLAVACAVRNRGSLRGVYGFKNPMADKQPAWVWKQAKMAWRKSASVDITKGATHWENVKAFGEPAWARKMKKTVTINDHTFYKK
jgi:hypothetical protein